MENAKKLKGTGIYINEDFSEAVRQKRKELLPAMRAARERGDIAYLSYDRLIVHAPGQRRQNNFNQPHNNKAYTASTPEQYGTSDTRSGTNRNQC
ncbi:hypothetical protein ABVT39_014222 [Epinephelus coioides]